MSESFSDSILPGNESGPSSEVATTDTSQVSPIIEVKDEGGAQIAPELRMRELMASIESNAARAAQRSRDIDDGHKYVVDIRGAIAGVMTDAEAALTTIRSFAKSAKKATADCEGASEAARQVSSLAAALQGQSDTLLEGLVADASAASKAKDEIIAAQGLVAEKSAHIHDAQVHATTVRASVDEILQEFGGIETEAEQYKARTQSISDQAATAFVELKKLAQQASAAEGAAAEARQQAEESAEASKTLSQRAEVVERRLVDYETGLKRVDEQCKAQLKIIESLLPGATSAGLAHAFNERRKTFHRPHSTWQWGFVIAIVLLVAVAITGLIQVYHMSAAPSYDEVLRLWLSRLPVAGALIWLALHASRESALAKRLEEDYGYKAAIASSFEGFRKQMSEVETSEEGTSPLAALCSNTLSTIAAPPGRIYDRHKLTVGPADEFAKAAHAIAKVTSRQGDSNS